MHLRSVHHERHGRSRSRLQVGFGLQEHHCAFDLLKKEEFRVAYRAVLGKFRSEWIAELSGPSAAGTKESKGGVEYDLDDSCKPHDCSGENLIVAYASSQSKVSVLLKTRTQTHVLGSPSSPVRSILERTSKAGQAVGHNRGKGEA
jgi:hypothetical protein